MGHKSSQKDGERLPKKENRSFLSTHDANWKLTVCCYYHFLFQGQLIGYFPDFARSFNLRRISWSGYAIATQGYINFCLISILNLVKYRISQCVVSKIKSRKYSQEYLNFGLNRKEIHKQEKPLCVICSEILAADS